MPRGRLSVPPGKSVQLELSQRSRVGVRSQRSQLPVSWARAQSSGQCTGYGVQPDWAGGNHSSWVTRRVKTFSSSISLIPGLSRRPHNSTQHQHSQMAQSARLYAHGSLGRPDHDNCGRGVVTIRGAEAWQHVNFTIISTQQ